VFWTAAGRDVAGIVRRNEIMEELEEGRRPIKGRLETKETEQPRKRGSDAQMNRQNSVESEQMLRTKPSIRSVSKERMIILFHSTVL
jgi:hypothetical protein